MIPSVKVFFMQQNLKDLDHTTITDDAVVAVQHKNLLPVATGSI